jgi:toxin FitB
VIILDTNVLSELTRELPERSVVGWFEAQRRTDLVTTSITKAEMFYGLTSMPSGKRQAALQQKVRKLFFDHFDGRVVPFDATAAEWYAAIAADMEKKGTPRGPMDTMIAAITASHDAILATRNVRHFEDMSLVLVDPWLFGFSSQTDQTDVAEHSHLLANAERTEDRAQ